jgi:hypothetical protein
LHDKTQNDLGHGVNKELFPTDVSWILIFHDHAVVGILMDILHKVVIELILEMTSLSHDICWIPDLFVFLECSAAHHYPSVNGTI